MSSLSVDLLIVGCGDLGRLIGSQWRTLHPTATIIGETCTKAAHPLIESVGITPAVRGQDDSKCPNVVFCAPPVGNEDYAMQAEYATSRLAENGRIVFTSSGSVYEDVDGIVQADSALASGPRAERLLAAERVVLQVKNSIVIRLSALYSRTRGLHRVLSGREGLPFSADSVIDMLHYDDAASAVVASLKVDGVLEGSERCFLVASESGLRIAEIAEMTVRLEEFRGRAVSTFTGEGPVRLRRYDAKKAKDVLGWVALYSGFGQFVEKELER